MATPAQNPPAIRACLFDMDGLLIDSEDIYTLVTNKILHEYGKPSIPWSIKAQLQGRPGPAAGIIFRDWAQLPISHDEFLAKAQALQAEMFKETKPLPGVQELLDHLRKMGMRTALATSSHSGNFKIKSAHLAELFAIFEEKHRVLGDDKRIAVGRGKPAPDIYLLALKTINDALVEAGRESEQIRPEECLVFEDSVPGVEAGRRAGMQVVWCPHPGLATEYKGREKEVLAGLTGEHKEEKIVAAESVLTPGQRLSGAAGEIDDGWAVHLDTLEDFPYERFGMSKL